MSGASRILGLGTPREGCPYRYIRQDPLPVPGADGNEISAVLTVTVLGDPIVFSDWFVHMLHVYSVWTPLSGCPFFESQRPDHLRGDILQQGDDHFDGLFQIIAGADAVGISQLSVQ